METSYLYISIIAFTNRASLKVNTKTPVMYYNNIVSYIRSYNNEVISENYVKRIYYDLLMSNIDSKDTRKEHIHSIKKKLREREIN